MVIRVLHINKIGGLWYGDRRKAYYLASKVNGPAIIDCNGTYWVYKGMLHRLDGPAKIYSNNRQEWYYDGEMIKCSSQEEYKRCLKLKLLW